MKKGKKRIVVALGGNALGNTPQEQISQVRFAAEIIADLGLFFRLYRDGNHCGSGGGGT